MRFSKSAALGLAVFGALAISQPAAAQVDINVRGGAAVPTFDIADAADVGYAFGGGVGLWLSDRLVARANVDFGSHSGADGGPDVNVNHYIAGLGYLLTDPASSFYIIVNLGAGALNFDVDAEGVESLTNFAINAGAEIGTWLSDSISLFLSPQGDIAFTDSDGALGTSTAWVWPFTAGLKVRLR
jgi:hypothetical protein